LIIKGIKEMQLNKVLKGLMLALPVMAIAACSSNKNASNDQSGEGMLGAGTGMDANGGGNMSSEEQARLQMQQLQQNNIVYFDLDKYDIRSDFAAMLDAHANFLRSNYTYISTTDDTRPATSVRDIQKVESRSIDLFPSSFHTAQTPPLAHHNVAGPNRTTATRRLRRRSRRPL
jgi:hypothetical protein